jgi:leader peptidase (prepilin peptidase) / N-methyltransferase
MFDREVWLSVPFSFWAAMFFVFGAIVGSFLNVCVHRIPRGESIISPPSHCPHCNYHIPWYLNLPLITWLVLRGHCANCKAPISIRYYLVELLTALMFWGAWIVAGPRSFWLALVYAAFFAGLIVATFIDVEHLIIPDEITLGGAAVGFLISAVVPSLHHTSSILESLKRSGWGILFGGGLIYLAVRMGKLLFGRQKLTLSPGSKIAFEETGLRLPDQFLPYEDIFYRAADTIELEAQSAVLGDRTFENKLVQLNQRVLKIGDEEFDPHSVPVVEIVTEELVIPREAMGFGDVKFMAMIGAFLGWQGVLFSIICGCFLGSMGGLLMILWRHLMGLSFTSLIPFGPYLATAAAIWVFGGPQILHWWINLLSPRF